MTAITFSIPGEPVPKERARVGRGGGYTPERTRAAEERVAWAFNCAVRGRGYPNGAAAFSIRCEFRLGNHRRVDVDNLLKTVLDGLNGVCYVDDSQVVEVHGIKEVCPGNPGTIVVVAASERPPRPKPKSRVTKMKHIGGTTFDG